MDIGSRGVLLNKTKQTTNKKNMNVRFPENDYIELQQIAENLGGMSLSSMIRVLVYSQLEAVRVSGNSRDFLNIQNISEIVTPTKES